MKCIYLRMYCIEIGMEYINLNKYKDEEAKVSIASERVPGGLLDLILSPTGETSKVTFHFPKRRHVEKLSR